MAQHIVALDIGKTAARVAVIAATFRRATLLGVDSVPIAPGQTTAELLQDLRGRIAFPIDSLICSLDARRASVRTLNFPFADVRRIAAAVDFELDGQIPYELSAVKVVWQVIEKDAKTTDVLAAIAPRSLLGEQLQVLREQQFEPRAVVHPAAALAELTPPTRGAEASTAILCVGAQQTHLSIHRKGLRAARTLHWGSQHIEALLAPRLELSLEEAVALKEGSSLLLDLDAVAGASAADRRLHDACADALAPLITHISATFKGIGREDIPSRLLLTGGGSRLVGLPRYLSQRLATQVESLDVRAALGALEVPDAAPVKPEHAVVLGLALGMFRRGQEMPLNFRQGELAYHGDIALFRGFFSRLAVGFACVFWAAFIHAGVRYGLLHAEEKDLTKGFCSATTAIVGKEICDPSRALATLRVSGADGGTPIPAFSATALLDMLSLALPSTVDVTFDELDVRVDGAAGQPERLTARGEAASFEAVEQVVALLKRDPCVQDADISRQRKTQNAGRVEFFLQVKVTCPAGARPGGTGQLGHRGDK
jgi:Tfp pilus assembly PilM family ATPase